MKNNEDEVENEPLLKKSFSSAISIKSQNENNSN